MRWPRPALRSPAFSSAASVSGCLPSPRVAASTRRFLVRNPDAKPGGRVAWRYRPTKTRRIAPAQFLMRQTVAQHEQRLSPWKICCASVGGFQPERKLFQIERPCSPTCLTRRRALERLWSVVEVANDRGAFGAVQLCGECGQELFEDAERRTGGECRRRRTR